MPYVGKSMDRKRQARSVICKYCGCRLVGVSPIKPFIEVYDRMCPERDGDLCERFQP